MNFTVVLQNGQAIEVEEAELQHDPLENSLMFALEGGSYAKFYWPNVSYVVAVNL